MTIAIDMRSASDAYGGIPLYTNRIVNHILGLESEHTFILFTNSFRTRLREGIAPRKDVRTLECHIPSKLLACSISLFGRPYLDEIIKKKIGAAPDVWFSPNINFTALSPACAFVLTLHDLSFEFFPGFFSPKMRFWHRAIAPSALTARADHIIAVSEHTRNDLVTVYGVPRDRVSVIHHGVCDDSEEEEDTRHPTATPKRYILMAGAGSRRKNLDTLIAAFCQIRERCPDLRDLHLLVTGIKGSASKNIQYRGVVSRRAYLTLLGNAQALVYPSVYEGFGLPLLESFALGTPVIASANSSISEIGGHAFFPIDPYNTESLASALVEVLRDTRLRAYLREQGFMKARTHSWDAAARKTLRALELVRHSLEPLNERRINENRH
jgi:glycosyltransferase involved in cell wall biosynthesis